MIVSILLLNLCDILIVMWEICQGILNAKIGVKQRLDNFYFSMGRKRRISHA